MSESGIFFDQKKSFLINGELARALIRRKRLRQYQIARKMRISNSALTRLLNREYKADTILITSLAQVLSVETSILVTEPPILLFRGSGYVV